MISSTPLFALALSIFAPVAPPTGPTEGVSGTIVAHRSNQMVAPEKFIFEPSALVGFDTPAPVDPRGYNRQVHEIEYYWDFGNPGATFAKLVNVHPWQKDANVEKGPVGSFVFPKGSHVVTCFAYEPATGKNTTMTLNIGGATPDTPEVQDPDVVFAGNKTFFVDPDGDYTGVDVPAGSIGYTDLKTALDATKAITEQRRVMLRSGKTFPMTHHVIRQDEGPRTGLYVCGQATGALPMIESLGSGTATFYFQVLNHDNTFDATLSRLKGVGSWNELTEANPSVIKSFVQQLTGSTKDALGNPIPPSNAHPDYFLMNDCDVGGFYNLLTQSGSPRTQKVHGVYDCVLRSWLNIVSLVENNTPTAYRGNLMARDPLALMGQQKFDGNAHGCVRTQSTGPLDISNNDAFNNAGWFQNAFGYSTQQPCFRIMQSGTFVPRTNFYGNSAEGGWPIVAFSQQDNGVGCHLQNIVADANTLVGTYQTNAGFQLGFGGVTLRNNLVVLPDTPRFNNIHAPESLARCTPAMTPADADGTPEEVLAANRAAPVRAYNNTVAMLATDVRFVFGVRQTQILEDPENRFLNKIEENNIVHSPNITGGVNAGPLDTTVMWTPRALGPRNVYDHYPAVMIGTSIPPGSIVTVPYNAGRGQTDYMVDTSGKKSPHKLKTAQGTFQSPATLEVTFAANGFSLKNLSPTVTWTAQTAYLILNALPNPAPRQAEYDTPLTTVARYTPQVGAPGYRTATTGLTTYRDGMGVLRTAPKSKGWREPA